MILNLYFANTIAIKAYACNQYVCLNDGKRFVCTTIFSPWLFSSLLREVCRRAVWGRGVGGGGRTAGGGEGAIGTQFIILMETGGGHLPHMPLYNSELKEECYNIQRCEMNSLRNSKCTAQNLQLKI